MAALDWSQCPAVESVPGKRSGAWVFKGTRTPISVVFENLPDMTVDEADRGIWRNTRAGSSSPGLRRAQRRSAGCFAPLNARSI